MWRGRRLGVLTMVEVVAVAGLLVACGTTGDRAGAPPSPPGTTATDTTDPWSADAPDGLPVDGDWTPVEIRWGVRPPYDEGRHATGTASPVGPLPADAWPADGFYDVTVTRVDRPADVLRMAIRRWVPCSQRPDQCPSDAAADALVADPASEVVRTVPWDDQLRVLLQPLQVPVDGRPPDPPQGLAGTGQTMSRLLSGWCRGPLPSQNASNCGVDHAVMDWVWRPYRAGAALDQVEGMLARRATDPGVPLGLVDRGTATVPCTPGSSCAIAYRGPHGTHLVVIPDPARSDLRLGDRLYGWWTSLQVEEGRPVLLIDTGHVADG